MFDPARSYLDFTLRVLHILHSSLIRSNMNFQTLVVVMLSIMNDIGEAQMSKVSKMCTENKK